MGIWETARMTTQYCRRIFNEGTLSFFFIIFVWSINSREYIVLAVFSIMRSYFKVFPVTLSVTLRHVAKIAKCTKQKKNN